MKSGQAPGAGDALLLDPGTVCRAGAPTDRTREGGAGRPRLKAKPGKAILKDDFHQSEDRNQERRQPWTRQADVWSRKVVRGRPRTPGFCKESRAGLVRLPKGCDRLERRAFVAVFAVTLCLRVLSSLTRD